MSKNQDNILNYFKDNFIIPSYFSAWLSGFIEAEGSFRFIYNKRRNMQIYGIFNIGDNNEHFIIEAIRDYFGATINIQTIISKSFLIKHDF